MENNCIYQEHFHFEKCSGSCEMSDTRAGQPKAVPQGRSRCQLCFAGLLQMDSGTNEALEARLRLK